MDERPEDEDLRETIAQVADTWHLFPEPGVLTTDGLSRAKGDAQGVVQPDRPERRQRRGKNCRP